MAGLHDRHGEQLGVGSPNPVAKAASIIGGMVAGTDSIDDLDLLRHGAMPRLVRRGTGTFDPGDLSALVHPWPRAASRRRRRRLLAGLAQRVPALVAGGSGAEGIAFIDVDDTIREVHGYAQAGCCVHPRIVGKSRISAGRSQSSVGLTGFELATPCAILGEDPQLPNLVYCYWADHEHHDQTVRWAAVERLLRPTTGVRQHPLLEAGGFGYLHGRPHHRLAERVATPQ